MRPALAHTYLQEHICTCVIIPYYPLDISCATLHTSCSPRCVPPRPHLSSTPSFVRSCIQPAPSCSLCATTTLPHFSHVVAWSWIYPCSPHLLEQTPHLPPVPPAHLYPRVRAIPYILTRRIFIDNSPFGLPRPRSPVRALPYVAPL